MTRGIGPLLVMAGLLLGPVHYIITQYLSGEPGPVFSLTERAPRWTLPDGTILHFAHGSAYRPTAIDLDPDMNRIGLELTFEFAAAPAPATDDYEAVLYQADQAILQRPLRVEGKPEDKRKIDAGSLEVFYPGNYVFVLDGPQAPQVPVTRVTLQVRKKIAVPSMPLVLCGVVILVVGLALSIEPYLRARRR